MNLGSMLEKGSVGKKIKTGIWGYHQLSDDVDVCIKVYAYLLTRIILQIALK